jgi:hypothetical protein
MTFDISAEPETATGTKSAAEITDKKGYAAHWSFSVRHIDNLLKDGLPHLKIGKRRVRIFTKEADAWMHEKFSTQRRGPVKRSCYGVNT